MSKNFDPSVGCDDEFISQQNEELYQQLLKMFAAQGRNRWDWSEIDYCWTWKDGDLETHGQQGLHVDSIDDEWVHATVHCGKTVPGDDVCLNDPKDADLDDCYRAKEIWLEQAQEVVCGCGCAGEWSGDDWYLTESYPIKVKTVLTPNLKLSKKTFNTLYDAAQVAVQDWDREMQYMAQILDVLSGWKDNEGNRIPEYTIVEGSAWDMLNWLKENAPEAVAKLKVPIFIGDIVDSEENEDTGYND